MDPDIRRALTRALGILGAALALCALGIWGTVRSVDGFAHAAGFTGTAGRFVAASCEYSTSEPTLVTSCRGVFHPDGDAASVPEARVDSAAELNREVPVRCEGAACHRVSSTIAVTWAAAGFAALAALALGCRLLLGLARVVLRPRLPEQLATGAAVTLALCALLSLVAALVTSIVSD
ncbi:hypothetical protein ACIRBX_02855 [Kitasatospora sp. NPDC096147]|uniref:hypothetical protein n=1 Tax=Kitasatospora sp. NPDC096147 TaxID=3364093 RepID=UPI0038283A2A